MCLCVFVDRSTVCHNICIDFVFLFFFYFFYFNIWWLNRPTFKTATLNSRTQLKQQLQREQLQELERQELERRENERKLSSMQSNVGCAAGASIDHNTQMAHSSHSSNAGQQLQVPRNCNTGIPQLYASSPTPSTSTEGSDFASSHYSNQSNPMPSHSSDHSNNNAPLKVPLHIGVDLPPQVLKVRDRFLTLNTQICDENWN